MQYHCQYTELLPASSPSLKSHPKNAYVHSEKQVKALSAVIERLGWRLPVIVSKRSGCIVAGHCRRMAGELLGCDVPVQYQEFESETEELDFLMADNIIPELAEWDADLKLSNLEELKLEDISFDIEPLDDDDDKEDNENPGVDPGERLIVEVECQSELEQSEVFELLTGRGYKCKVMGI